MASKPVLDNLSEDNGIFKFTLSNVNVSVANSLRRCIISEIPTYGFTTFPYEQNQVKIKKNTTRFNNEILKQRISCIPIHNIHKLTNHEEAHKDLLFELKKKNTSSSIEYVTTEDFKIKNTKTNKYLTKEDVNKIFPPDPITKDHILVVRLRPRISDEVPGEEIDLEGTISLNKARENNMFNTSCTCYYNFTPDRVKQNQAWAAYEKEYSGKADEEVKKNWYLHNGLRHTVQDSFDFTIETVGVYKNKELFKNACSVMIDKIRKCSSKLEEGEFNVEASKSTISNCYDVILKNEDYTLGKVIEYLLYANYFRDEQIMTYIGFRKNHPHDDYSVLRVAFKKPISNDGVVKDYIKKVNVQLVELYEQIADLIV